MTIIRRILLLGFGVVFALVALVGVAGVFQTQNIVDTYTRVQGTVAEVDQGVGADGDLEFTAIIQYTAGDGETWQFRSSVTSNSRPARNAPIDVLYDPSNPRDAIEDSFAALWLMPVVALGVGIAGLVGLIVFAVVLSRRRQNRVQPRETISDRNAEVIIAKFSHVQPRGPDQDGRFQYRVVAVRKVGGIKHTYQSDWVDEDPTVSIMTSGNDLPVRLNSDGTGEVLLSGT